MRNIVEVNTDNLPQEFLDYPSDYYGVLISVAEAQEVVTAAKAKLELVKATVSLAVRDSPTAYKLKKVTEDTVSAAVVSSSQYQTAVVSYNAALADLGKLKALKEALRAKRSSLEMLGKFQLAGVWSPISLSGSDRRVVMGTENGPTDLGTPDVE